MVVVNLQGTDHASLSTADSILSMMKFATPKSPTKVSKVMTFLPYFAAYTPPPPSHPFFTPLPPLTTPKLIVISSIGVWGSTVSSSGNPIDSTTFQWRVPSPTYTNHKRLEDLALSIASVSNLEVTVLCPGVLYGCGEEHFYMTFRDAWQYQTTPVLVPALSKSNGSNTLPTTHVLDLCSTVLTIARSMSSPVPAYTLLTDGPNATLTEITKSIASRLNGTSETRVMKDANYESVALEHPEFRILNLNLFVDNSKCGTAALSLKYAGAGIMGSMETVAKQFVEARSLEPIRVAITSPPGLTAATDALVKNLKGRYSLPLVTPITVVEMLLKEDEGSSKVRDEVAAVWNAEEGGKDLQKISPPLMARAFCRALQSAACKTQGYIMVGVPTSENNVNVVFSDEPVEKEGEEGEEQEQEEPAKGKDKGKKGKKGAAEEAAPVEKVEEREVNPLKAPTHVINLASSDEQLVDIITKANTKPPAEGEETETIDQEAVDKFKEELMEFRAQEKTFGQRPAVEEEEEKKENEDSKDAQDAKEGDEAVEISKSPATSVWGWMEEKCNAKVLHLPGDEAAAEELSSAFIPPGERQDTYIQQFIEDGQVPGITFMTDTTKVEEEKTPASPAQDAAPEAVEDPASVPAPALEAAPSPPSVPSSLLPHELVYEDVTLEEANEISSLTSEYRKFCSDNVMKEVTVGMMKILKSSSSDNVDVVDLLADHLIAEGKRMEKEGEEEARFNFDSLLQHVDALSSRILEGRRDDSTMATGTVFSGFSTSKA